MGSLVCHWRQGQDEPLKILTKKCGSLVCHWECWAMAARTREAPQDCAEELGKWWLLAMLGQGHQRYPSRLCRRIGEMVVAGDARATKGTPQDCAEELGQGGCWHCWARAASGLTTMYGMYVFNVYWDPLPPLVMDKIAVFWVTMI